MRAEKVWFLLTKFVICSLLALAGASLHSQMPTTIPIQGNLGAILGTPSPYAGVFIQLQNCASPIAITGYSVIVQPGYQIQANASGVVNSNIWPNDEIDCNGTTGTSQYQVTFIVNGTPAGTPQCYQVTSTQGIWNLNTQQPIACTQTPPNPQDGTYRNLTVTGFLQANNGDFSGNLEVDGLLKVLGGIQLGTMSQTCSGEDYMTGFLDTLVPICTSLPGFTGLTSFNGRTTPAAVPTTGDYSYSMISSTPVFGSTPAAPSGLQNVTFQASGTANSAYIPATAVTPGTYTYPQVTVQQDGRITSISTLPSPILASVTFTSCTVGADGGSVWDCTGSASWGTTLANNTYKMACTLGGGNITVSNIGGAGLYINSKSTTGFSYSIGTDHSGANGWITPIDCIATN